MWDKLKLPDDLTGRTFLDIGCWEGGMCVEAVKRNASRVVGIDLCTCASLWHNLQAHPFEFVQMDVMSSKFWQVGAFDVVLCAGVLYHVESPLDLLFRLRKVTGELLVLETALSPVAATPVLEFCPSDSLNGNYSNWWLPNASCLRQILPAAGFKILKEFHPSMDRFCIHAQPCGDPDLRKALPRREAYTSVYGGERQQPEGK